MHLMRSIESTPMDVPSHVRHALAALTMRATTATYGMMFLHELNLTDDGSVTLPGVKEEDDRYLRAQLDMVPKRKPKSFAERPRITVEYPLGEMPTWNNVKDTLKKQPLKLIRSWERPLFFHHIPTAAGILFVEFTRSLWVSVKSDWTEGNQKDLEAVENLDGAMAFWSAESIVMSLKAVSFSMNRFGIKGVVRGSQDAKSFRERTWIYFPEADGVLPPRGSKWVPFFAERVGYIRRYHEMIKGMGEEEDRQNLKDALEDIFAQLQCLPDSEGFTEAKEGKTWCRAAGEDAIGILVNIHYMRFKEIGRTREVRDGPRRSHVTRPIKEVISELFKQHGLVEEAEQLGRRRWRAERKGQNQKKSDKSKKKRKPPTKKMAVVTEEEDSESSSSNSL